MTQPIQALTTNLKPTFSHARLHTNNNETLTNPHSTLDQQQSIEPQASKGLMSRFKSFFNSNNSIFLGVFTAEILEFIVKHPLVLMIAVPFLAVYLAYKVTKKVMDPLLNKIKNWSQQKLTQVQTKNPQRI